MKDVATALGSRTFTYVDRPVESLFEGDPSVEGVARALAVIYKDFINGRYSFVPLSTDEMNSTYGSYNGVFDFDSSGRYIDVESAAGRPEKVLETDGHELVHGGLGTKDEKEVYTVHLKALERILESDDFSGEVKAIAARVMPICVKRGVRSGYLRADECSTSTLGPYGLAFEDKAEGGKSAKSDTGDGLYGMLYGKAIRTVLALPRATEIVARDYVGSFLESMGMPSIVGKKANVIASIEELAGELYKETKRAKAPK